MLKSRFAVTAIVLALLVALAPAPSQAAAREWTVASVPPMTSLFEKIGTWWSRVLNTPERLDRQQPATTQPKLGCGIDPNGTPMCGPDPLLSPPPPGDSKG